MKILVIGYGNPIRGDDGLGIFLAGEIDARGFPGVEVRTCQQLQCELIEEFRHYDRIILIDASMSGPGTVLRRIQADHRPGGHSSHHLDPSLLLGLAELLGEIAPEVYLCAVPGEEFGFGQELSPFARTHAARALSLIENLIQQELHHA